MILAFLCVAQTIFAEEETPVIEQASAVASDVEQPEEKTEAAPEATTESYLIEQTNAYRAKYNLEPLTENKKLNEACQKFAEVMARTGQMSHYADDLFKLLPYVLDVFKRAVLRMNTGFNSVVFCR